MTIPTGDHHLLPGNNFVGADTIFEGIVSIRLFDAEPSVTVARPASTEVEAFVDPPNSVFPADS